MPGTLYTLLLVLYVQQSCRMGIVTCLLQMRKQLRENDLPHLAETMFYLMTVAGVQALFILPHHLPLLRLELDNNLQDAGCWIGGNESESPSLCCPECLIDPVMLLLLEGLYANS